MHLIVSVGLNKMNALNKDNNSSQILSDSVNVTKFKTLVKHCNNSRVNLTNLSLESTCNVT